MIKENFKNLLTDLYRYYNPEYLQHVEELAEKYHRMEHSAVEMILMKYNHRNSPYFDEAKSTESYMFSLIKEYDKGNRILEGLKAEPIKKEKEELVGKSLLEQNNEKISKSVDERIRKVQEQVKEEVKGHEEELKKLIDKYTEYLKDLDKKLENQKPINISHFDAVDIKINLYYTESEINLPNKEILASLGVGSRILVLNKENKPIGLEVKDITYDCVSNIMIGGKPTLEITLERA